PQEGGCLQYPPTKVAEPSCCILGVFPLYYIQKTRKGSVFLWLCFTVISCPVLWEGRFPFRWYCPRTKWRGPRDRLPRVPLRLCICSTVSSGTKQTGSA